VATPFSPGVKTILLEEDSDDNEDADLWFVLLLLMLLVVVVASFGFGPDVVELLLLDEVDDEINSMRCGVLVVVIVNHHTQTTGRTIIRW
jgi:hypothetical protein